MSSGSWASSHTLKNTQELYCTSAPYERAWPQPLPPGQEGTGRKGTFLLHRHSFLNGCGGVSKSLHLKFNQGLKVFALRRSFGADRSKICSSIINPKSKTNTPPDHPERHHKAKSPNTAGSQARPSPANKSGLPWNYRISSRTRRKRKGIYGSSQGL